MNADVARIIGWNPHEIEAEKYGDPFFPYTADDLAAWVHERYDWINLSMCWGEHGEIDTYQIEAVNTEGDGYNEPMVDVDRVEASGPTILGCLEQLVLQIGAS